MEGVSEASLSCAAVAQALGIQRHWRIRACAVVRGAVFLGSVGGRGGPYVAGEHERIGAE